ALFEPVEPDRHVRLMRLARLELDLYIDRRLPIGREGQARFFDKDREGHDPGKDRHGIAAWIADAKTTSLPDPVLPRMPFAHAFAPVDAHRFDALFGEDRLGPLDGGIV